MSEEKYCEQHSGICKNIEELKDKVIKLEADLKELDKKLYAREKEAARAEEQIKMIFKILTEIKDSIKDIAKNLDDLEKKPGRRWDDTIKTIITVVVTYIVTLFMSKLLG